MIGLVDAPISSLCAPLERYSSRGAEATPRGSSALAWTVFGWANIVTSTATPPSSSTALAKPAEACSRNGPMVFFQASARPSRRLRRLRAFSWLTATRMRSSRSSGAGTGPSSARDVCVCRRESHSRAQARHASRCAPICCISRPFNRPSRYSVNTARTSLQPFIPLIPPPLRRGLTALCKSSCKGHGTRIRGRSSQQGFQKSAAARQARFHRAQIHSLHLCDFFVNKAFNIAQDESRPERLRNLVQGRFNTGTIFGMRGHIEWRFARIDQSVNQKHRGSHVAVVAEFLLNGDFLLLVPHPPSPLVCGLAQRDPVDPGPQRRFAMKALHAAEDLHEDFLRKVGSVGAIAKRARQQRENWLMIACDQPRKRFFRAGPQLFDKSCFFGMERQRAGDIAHDEIRLQTVFPSIYTAKGVSLAYFRTAA